jgi:hypothetical protein
MQLFLTNIIQEKSGRLLLHGLLLLKMLGFRKIVEC